MYYEPGYYSFRLYDVDFDQPETELSFTKSPVKISILSEEGYLYMKSTDYDEMFLIDLQKANSYYSESWNEWATCMTEVGCVLRETSSQEYDALVDFY